MLGVSGAMTTTTSTGKAPWPRLDEQTLGPGKTARLRRILYGHGLRNGTALFLPYDQGLEHGPRDFFANPAASDPRYVVRLALEGGFNGIVLQVGLADRFFHTYAGQVPLILKLNGKTDIPSDSEAFSPLHATVEEAVRLGADAVGYTLYVGSPAQARDFEQYRQVRADAARLGMPLVVWAYPRGSAIEARGGKDSFYAVDYAARTASELGADVVKLNFPHPEKRDGVPEPYRADHQPGGGGCRGSLGELDAGPDLGRYAKRRRDHAAQGSRVHGGRCDRPHLREERLAARSRRVAEVRRRAALHPGAVLPGPPGPEPRDLGPADERTKPIQQRSPRRQDGDHDGNDPCLPARRP